MARPQKQGLDYFPFDVDYHDDFKIMDLLNEYGPLGCKIFEITLCKVYKNGYYLDVSLDKLAVHIVRIIGNRWIKDKNLVLQVIQYCADIGLFDKALLTQSVITSVGIQRRYSEVTVRNKADKSKYWLLEKENQAVAISEPPQGVSAAETGVIAAETGVFVTEMPQKKSKENKNKEKENKENKTRQNKSSGVSLISADGSLHEISDAWIYNFQHIFRELDIRQELVRVMEYFESNPSARVSEDKLDDYLLSWFKRAEASGV